MESIEKLLRTVERQKGRIDQIGHELNVIPRARAFIHAIGIQPIASGVPLFGCAGTYVSEIGRDIRHALSLVSAGYCGGRQN